MSFLRRVSKARRRCRDKPGHDSGKVVQYGRNAPQDFKSGSRAMSDFDLIIANGAVATASDTFRADVGIRDGRIVALAADLKGALRTIDATDRLVLPGGIDSHVHVSQPSGPGIVMADDFESATRSAAFGGNTL